MHNKYIKRGGKRFGPYLYKTYRENGQIKTVYMGKSQENSSKFPIYFLLALIVSLGLLFFIYGGQFTGHAISIDKTTLQPNEPLAGYYEISLKEGELLPSDSTVNIMFAGNEKKMLLKDFISLTGVNLQESSGDYYSTKAEISGSGLGYGWIGEKISYPEVQFELEPEIISIQEVQPEQIIHGSASYGNEFSYNGIANLVPGSVNVNGNTIPDDSVVVIKENGNTVVKTDYKAVANGYGESYLTSNAHAIDLDLSKLNLTSETEGTKTLLAEMSYNSIILSSESKTVDVVAEQAVSEEPEMPEAELPIPTITADVSACGNLTLANTAYTLQNNVYSNGTCFIINASSITLDCAGNSITGNLTGYGINFTGFNNLTVKNCIIQNFTSGIYFYNSSNSRIYNNTIRNMTGIKGINASMSYDAPAGAGSIGAGIYLSFSTGNNLSSNTISNIAGGSGGLGKFLNSGGTGGIGAGIFLSSSTGNNLSANTISNIAGGNGGDGGTGQYGSGGAGGIGSGIYLNSSTGNNLSANTINNAAGGSGGSGGYYGNPAGATQQGYGIFIDSSSLNNEIGLTNTVNGDAVIYFYNKTGIIVLHKILTANSNPTNLGKIVLINSSGTIYNNTIANFRGIAGKTGDLRQGADYIPAEGGAIGAGIYFSASKGNLSTNTISNITGGQGGTGGPANLGGAGGIGAGIYFPASTGNNLSSNTISNIIGGNGGKGGVGGSDNIGGNGEIGAGIYFSASTGNNLSANTISNVTGGSGGTGDTNGTSAKGSSIYLLYSSDNNILNSNAALSDYGIYLNSSNNVVIANNNATGNAINDIYIISSGGIKIQNYSNIGSYNFSNAGLIFEDIGEGKIEYIPYITQSGTKLNTDVNISYNLIYVNESKSGLNQNANLTLYNLGFGEAYMLRNSQQCPASICTKLSYNYVTGDLIFRVTGFTNYSAENITCGATLTHDLNFTNDLKNATGGTICFGNGLNIGADNIMLDCNGYKINGNGGSIGVNISSKNNVTVKNCALTGFSQNIKVYSSSGINIKDSSNIGSYNFSSSGLIFEDSGEGKIAFFPPITEQGDNLNNDVRINYNSVFVNSSAQPGFNNSANITLYNINFGNPIIQFDSNDNGIFITCNSTTNPVCYNLSWDGSTFVFNTTHFTAFRAFQSLVCGGTVNSSTAFAGDLLNSTGGTICPGNGLNIGADSIVLDCNSYKINGAGSSIGVNISSKNNVTVKNCTLTGFSQNIKAVSSSGINIKDFSNIGSYNFSSSGLIFEDSGEGKIEYIPVISQSGTNLSADIGISYNLIYVNEIKSGLNQSANLTLYGLNYDNPAIYRNNVLCPASTCTLLSSSGGITVFNVTGFTNYSIGIGCGSTIIDDTTLTGNLTCNGDALSIGANNVVLDCQDHEINLNDAFGYGVNEIGQNNVTIKNCVLTHFYGGGILLQSSTNGTLTNNAFHDCGGPPIQLISSDGNNISNNRVLNAQGGFYNAEIDFSSSNNNIISNNNISTFMPYIYFDNSDNNVITNNKLSDGGGGIYGIVLGNSNSNNLTNNTISTTDGVGISIYSSSLNFLSGNNFTERIGGVSYCPAICIDGNYNQSIDTTNIVNGDPFYYIFANDSTTIKNLKNIVWLLHFQIM